ncbi:MAG: RNA polymerase sigma factor [Pseudonocardiaceae bacterium]
MAHRSSPSHEPSDDVDDAQDAGPCAPIPDEALALTEASLSSAEEGETEDERAMRLVADRQFIEILAAENFEGERFNMLFRQLVYRLTGYAWPTLMKWIINGDIFRECLRYKRPVRHPAVAHSWTSDERCQIATDTIIEAVDFFRDYGLRQGKWDWRRGASLGTYFVGACVCCFPKVLKRWCKEKQVAESLLLAAQDIDDPSTGDPPDRTVDTQQPDPATTAVVRDEAHRMMRRLPDPQLREVLWLRAIGYGQAEAANKAGLTEKAAERRLHRHRAKLRDMPPGPVDPDDGRKGSL